MNPKVDAYLMEGCGRCPLGGTPECKVHNWEPELLELRRIVLDCDLKEEYKWSQPCYTFQGKNVLLITALKDYCAVSFFKGSLLDDSSGILSKPGEHSQAARLIRFTAVQDILEMEALVKVYIQAAIAVEKAGLKVQFKKETEPIPAELQQQLAEDPALKKAFFALTRGRQRGYILYFSAPKQSKTRIARIERYKEKILAGKGFHDR